MGMKQWGKGAVELLQTYSWPGNIRELKNFVERLVIMSTGETIGADEVSRVLATAGPSPDYKESSIHRISHSLKEMLESYEKEILLQEFKKAEGNVSQLARILQIDRANLHRKLKAYGIK